MKLQIRKYFIAIPWETEGHDSRCCRTLVSSIELFWSELFVNHQRIDAALMGFWGRPAAAKQMQLDVSRTGP